MENRYTILQHETRTFYLVDCPILLVSHAITKDNQNNTIFVQCKFENTLSKPIKALYISVKCYDVTNQSLSDVESFSYLDILVNQYETFGDKTPVILPDKETRNISITPVKIVFEDGSTWENRTNLSFVEFEYNNTTISELGELAEEYRRELHHICLQSDRHNYLPIRKDGYTVCGCGKIVVEAEKTCPACGVDLETLFALNDVDKLQAGLEQYKQEQVEREKIENFRKIQKHKKWRRYFYIGIPVSILLVLCIGIFAVKGLLQHRQIEKAANSIAAGYDFTVCIAKDGTLMDTYGDREMYGVQLSAKDIKGIFEKVAAKDGSMIAIREDGTVIDNVNHEERIKQVEQGERKPYDVEKTEWSDIVYVADGYNHKVGVKDNGTVVAYGSNDKGQCEVSEWEDIVQVAAGLQFTIGLRSDGTCIATGENDHGECEVSAWNNIKSISAGNAHTVGLRENGRVVATGYNKDGSCDVSEWKDIIAISSGAYHTVGLKKDGSVVAIGRNDEGQCNVSDWTDVVAISAGTNHTVGVKKDGTVVAVGSNEHGQCNVSDWDLW